MRILNVTQQGATPHRSQTWLSTIASLAPKSTAYTLTDCTEETLLATIDSHQTFSTVNFEHIFYFKVFVFTLFSCCFRVVD